MAGLREEKAALRKSFRRRRQNLPGREAKSGEIARRVEALELFQKAEEILLYLSNGSEPDTWALLDRAWQLGKGVFAPRCFDGEGAMGFFRVRERGELLPGRFGLREPDPQRCERWRPGNRALCLVPGLCFDRQGRRLGYGKGYYDRFLAAYPLPAAGLCFGDLLVPRLPGEEHDRSVALVVTEEETVFCLPQGRCPGKDGAL